MLSEKSKIQNFLFPCVSVHHGTIVKIETNSDFRLFRSTDDVLEARSSNGNITVRGALFKKYQNSNRAVQMQK
jgi:hypothetical protein